MISGSFREMSVQALMKFEGPAVTRNGFWIFPRSRPFIQGTLRRARKVLRLVALRISPTFVDHGSTIFLKTVSLCCVVECVYVFAFKLIRFDQSFFGATFAVHLICQVGFVIGNPSGSRL